MLVIWRLSDCLRNNQRRRCLKKTWKRTGNKRSVGDMKLVTREDQEELEHACLSGDAAFSDETEGRRFSTEGDLYRSEYQRDRIRSCTLKHSVVFPIKHKFFLLLKGIIIERDLLIPLRLLRLHGLCPCARFKRRSYGGNRSWA